MAITTACYYCGLPTRNGACDDCGTVPSAFAQAGMDTITPESAARIRAAHEAAQSQPQQPCACTPTTCCDDCAW